MSVSVSGTTVTFPDSSTITSGWTGFKNRIINGAMVIDQRNAGASLTANNSAFPVDRFRMDCTQSSKGTVQQNAGSITPPTGYTNYVGFTSSSAYSVLSTDEFTFTQNIEGLNCADLAWGTANASSVTLSFWVRSSLTGTFGGCVSNNSANRSYPFSYTISSANTWTQISITIAGDTTGTWLTTNGIGIRVFFSLGAGSNYSGTAGSWVGSDTRSVTGATSVVGTNGATWYITGVQLEKGSTASSFEYRAYGQELALCQRYYAKMTGSSGGYCAFGSGRITSATNGDIYIKFPTTLRVAPTITASSTAVDCNVFVATTTMSASYVGFDSALCSFTMASGGATTGQGATLIANNNTSAFIALSSEL